MSTFEFRDAPLDPAALSRTLADPGAGGFASFEGWVRDHHEGRRVTGLDYEAFEELARAEGERIVAAAVERHGVLAARCVHRVGRLAIGELAVWVGAASAHRAEAFAACREIIDEIKHRLPIWKKEHYVEGDSGWVNCERCAEAAHDHRHGHDHAPAGAAAFDYARQMALPEVGSAGQQRLAEAAVVVIGAGGLGCAVLTALAGAGIGTLQVVDDDTVEASNLHRQPLYTVADIGRPKAEAATERLAAYNPRIVLHAHPVRFTAANAAALISAGDLVVDCSDNFAAKFLVNDVAVLTGRPAVLASIHQYEGQLQVVRPDTGGSCLRCLWPEAMRDGLVGNCVEAGVLGPVPAVLGNLQAIEVLKILLDLPGQLRDELLLVDLLGLEQRRLRVPRAAECAGRCTRIGPPVVETSGAELELTLPLATAAAQGYRIIDIREPEECYSDPLGLAGHDAIPMGRLLDGVATLDPGERYLLVCTRGARSLIAARQLRAGGRNNVWSLRGGLLRAQLPGAQPGRS
ncbi:MAG: molybdopterin converting factor [Gammaproteobacteria bacterium]|nr:MAG: molybdopterin converting factor [Gammaproteobacteria bacterium]